MASIDAFPSSPDEYEVRNFEIIDKEEEDDHEQC